MPCPARGLDAQHTGGPSPRCRWPSASRGQLQLRQKEALSTSQKAALTNARAAAEKATALYFPLPLLPCIAQCQRATSHTHFSREHGPDSSIDPALLRFSLNSLPFGDARRARDGSRRGNWHHLMPPVGTERGGSRTRAGAKTQDRERHPASEPVGTSASGAPRDIPSVWTFLDSGPTPRFILKPPGFRMKQGSDPGRPHRTRACQRRR